ncbi:DUF6049 family protein [Williamsia deligens]|uniref:DUF6049 family protein n=1 Tax=Williamsia deligens TaxID=321325 RepID=A0ABW3G963_9NOCA|nr:DUF6049 family protein [Williamsia deligens]MCP2193812.1 hypothetical protein [Williamsia deligens]
MRSHAPAQDRRRPALVVAVVALLAAIAVPMTATPAPARAAPAHSSPALAAPAQSAPGQSTRFPEAARFVSLALGSVTPAPVTTSSPSTVTVTGTLTNIGDRDVRDLVVRLQRGQPVASGSQTRTSLTVDPSQYEVVTPFVAVPGTLAPGASTSFRISVPLAGDPRTPGLEVDRPGVYPLLVNVNGTPDYGSAARLDDTRTLLSVLGVPADRTRTPATPVAPVTTNPARTTVLWPLAAPGQLAPGVPGVGGDPVRLINEDLATSVRSGGRLRGLLDTVGEATRDPSSALARSICLEIDPDLLVTLQAMSRGYVVSTNPADPRAPTRDGTGASDAADYLSDLHDVAGRSCSVAMPFGQVDLDSLSRAADPALTRTGLRSPADLVDSILGVRSVRGMVLPTSGAVSDAAAQLITDSGSTSALLGASSVDRSLPTADGRYRVGSLSVATYDPAVTTALAAMGAAPDTPAITPADERFDLDTESPQARRGSATGAITYAALSPTTDAETVRIGGTPDDPTTGRSEVIAPPAVWSASADDAAAVLGTVDTLLRSDLAAPLPFGDLVGAAASATTPASIRLPPDTTVAMTSLDTDTVTAISRTASTLFALEASMVAGNDVAMSPRTYVAPLAEDLLRAMRSAPVDSTSDRRAVTQVARTRVSAVGVAVNRMRDAVAILDPGGRYTLASERSPLLLVVRNDLPLSIRVRLDTSAPKDLDIGDIGVVEIPPRGTRQIQLPTQARSSSSMTVNIALVTSSNVAVGSAIDLSVHSNAYGKPLFIITICAGVLLVLLAGRRLWHRFRGQPDPADLDRPEPDDRDRLMADSRYLHSADVSGVDVPVSDDRQDGRTP